MYKDELDGMDNGELMQHARDTHGALYKRINSLQRDLNIANTEVTRLKEKLADKDAKRITRQDALDAFSKLLDDFYERRK